MKNQILFFLKKLFNFYLSNIGFDSYCLSAAAFAQLVRLLAQAQIDEASSHTPISGKQFL
jgi:hypothetical protein